MRPQPEPDRAGAPISVCGLCGSSGCEWHYEKGGHQLERCVSCGLVYVSDPPSPAELETLYSLGSGYHSAFRDSRRVRWLHMWEARRRVAILAAVEPRAGSLLDVGCSAGFFLKAATDAGWTATGVEMSAGTAELARSSFGVEVHHGTLDTVCSLPGGFDALTMWDVLEHVPDPGATLDSARELLRPSGLLGLLTPNIDGLFPRVSYELAGRIGYWAHPDPPGHLFQFSEKTLTRLLELHDFRVERVIHRRIPLFYNAQGSARRLTYALAFAPLSLAGPWLKRGDELMVLARRRP